MKINWIILYFLFLILLFHIILKNKIKENMSDDITSIDWDDPHKNCKKINKDNCVNLKNCFWSNGLKKCINSNYFKNPCDSYNDNYLNQDSFLKKKMCKSIGCNFDKNTCFEKKFKNHQDYCFKSKDEDACLISKDNCYWDKKNKMCLSNDKQAIDFCNKFNDPNIKTNNKCVIKDIKNNFSNCYVNLKRDTFTKDYIPHTGLKDYRKNQCKKFGCNFIESAEIENGLCVTNDIKNQDDICLNYYKENEKINPTKCKQIGCIHNYFLNKDNGGICLSKYQNKRSKTQICKSINDIKKCIKIGCVLKQGKCH